ncbi:MAG: nicotinate-nucleotide adenylyltransferase [Clostridia bacterium]|nr:nicotinate-nucleotide adenylyltransferase [Clostridia bacterium]
MLRIGIFGGTFSPPHNGHIYIAREAMKKARLDKMVFVPCGNPYHKKAPVTVDAKQRLEMVRLAIDGEAGFEICDIEVGLKEPSYTARTLEKLQKIYPQDRLCFLVGGDSLLDMEGWYHPEEIFKKAEIIVAKRGGMDSAEINAAAQSYRSKYGADIKIIQLEPIDVSASDIRERLRCGYDAKDMISERVLKYIKENKIYEDSI